MLQGVWTVWPKLSTEKENENEKEKQKVKAVYIGRKHLQVTNLSFMTEVKMLQISQMVPVRGPLASSPLTTQTSRSAQMRKETDSRIPTLETFSRVNPSRDLRILTYFDD